MEMNKIINQIWSKSIPHRNVVKHLITNAHVQADYARRNAGIFAQYTRTPCWPECKICEERGYKY